MHSGANHWLMSFSSNGRVQICDTLYKNLNPVIKNCLKTLYKSKVEKNQNYLLPYTSAEAERWLQLRVVCNCVCNGCIEQVISSRFLF